VLRARQERRLGGVASALGGKPVAVRCQAFGGAFVDTGPELGYVRWQADGTPEPGPSSSATRAATWPPTSVLAGTGPAGRR
jgi:hypothetical protein